MPLPYREPRDPAQHQVLANPADEVGQFTLDGFAVAGERRGLERLDIALGVDRQRRDRAYKRLKQLVAGDEIGFGIDLDDGTGPGRRGDPDKALSGDAAGLLRRRSEALLAQSIERRLEITVALGERALAIHHPGAGLLAQFLDQRGGDLSHRLILSVQAA